MSRMFMLLCFLSITTLFPQEKSKFELREGDLLFQDLDCGPLCDAIETVTHGINGGNFSHIGLVIKDSLNNTIILEAISEKVKTTSLKDFLGRSSDKQGNPKVVAGRFKPEYRNIVGSFIKEAKSFIGKPYDNEYVMDNDSYYCSELIYLAALKANGGKTFFELKPMTFKDPSTGNFYPAWVKYYEDLKTKIPEGEPGINPGGISLSDKIEIVHIFGYPSGWKTGMLNQNKN